MNRSEELCELLNLDKYKSCGNCNPPSSLCCGGCEQEEEHYPDLTNPSNFVKLLECISDHLTPYGGVEIDTKGTDYIISIRDMCEDIKAKTFQEGLIVCAIEILNNNELWSDWWDCDEIGDDIRTNFISQAQATKWDY